MKKFLLGAVCAVVSGAAFAGDVGVSISIGQPGFYGQINIGDVPQPPPLIYARPLVIERGPDYIDQPVYLHVPPGYERHWSRHCLEYHACGRPVYFVNRDWYQREYVPHYQRGEWGRGHDEGRRYEEGRRHEEDRPHDQGRGHDEQRRHGHDDEHGHDHEGDRGGGDR